MLEVMDLDHDFAEVIDEEEIDGAEDER